MNPLRIRIVGGSLAGLFAALLLQRRGHDVKIYERSVHGLGGRGAGLVPQQDVYTMLRQLELDHVAQVGVVARERIYLDKSGGMAQVIRVPQVQISWDYLYNELVSNLDAGNYVLGSRVARVQDGRGGAEIHFDDGRSETADLVIGADGIGSVVRRSLNPTAADNSYAGYVAWRGLIPERNVPAKASTLLERFSFYVAKGDQALGYLVPGAAGEMSKGSRRYNWVWYRPVAQEDLPTLFTDQDGRQSAYSLPRGGLSPERLSALRQDAEDRLPPQFSLAVAAEETPSIQGIFDYEAGRMAGSSVVLIGDAAFVVRPHTAMGVSKAAGDVTALNALLATRRSIAEALSSFERERSAVGRDIAAYGRRLGETAI